MTDFYGEGAKYLQSEFDTDRLAKKALEVVVHDHFTDDDKSFIESRDMVFIATVDEYGIPQCSYKGGEKGFIRILDPKTLVMPNYNGNGLFLSCGNMLTTKKVGLLFVDFENPNRLRMTGELISLSKDDQLLKEYHEAEMIIRIKPISVFINCPRYVHRYQKVETSKFVPKCNTETPVADWMTDDLVRDVLPKPIKDKVIAERRRRGLE